MCLGIPKQCIVGYSLTFPIVVSIWTYFSVFNPYCILYLCGVGATSLHSGQIEVMLDRRHDFYDHAGVTDPLRDNVPVLTQFKLVAETVSKPVSLCRRGLVRSNLYRAC